MKNLSNNIQLIGNLGRDVEIITFDSGSKLAKFSLATNEYFKNNKGEKVEETQWHNVVAWGNLAENIASSLTKGSPVLVRGKLTYRSFKDDEGNMKYVSEVVANGYHRMGSKKETDTAPF